MAVRGGKKVSVVTRGGIRLRSVDAFRDAVLFLDVVNTAPTTTAGICSLYTNGTNLLFDNGSTILTIGGGGGGTPTWETLFANDATMTMTPDNTFTIAGNRATATDVVTITNIAGGSGSCLQITNSGSGNDIDGTSNTWGVTALGAATFLTLTLSGTTITSTAADVAWALEDNDATALSIGAAGETDMMVFDTRTGVETVTFNNNLNMVDGNATFISTSNTVTNLLVTNNTITTFGAAANSAGAVVIRSTSLTTGALLQLQLSDTANAGGFYLSCRESVGGTNDFTVGENGVVVALGTAGSNSFTLSNGDVLISDGSISIIDADDANSFSVVNDTATTVSVISLDGSGVFTGTTTASWMTLQPSGLTTGTALYVNATAASTSVGVIDIITDSLTSGTTLRITESTAAFTTGGKMIELDYVAAVAGNGLTVTTTGAYTGTGMVLLTAGAATTGILLSLVSTTGMTSGSLLRMTTSTAGAVATNGICSIRATGAYTSTSNAGLLDVQASALVGTGTIVNIQATNGSQLTNTALNVEQTTTGAGYTGDFVRIVGTSTTGDCNLIAVTSASTSAGDALSITNNSLVAGTSTIVNLIHGTSVLGAGNSMLRITSTGADTGTTTGCLVDLASSTATAGTLVLMTSATMATGAGMVMTLAGLTTGVGLSMTHATAVIANGGSMFRLDSGGIDTATTSGCLVDLTSTASTAGTQVLMTLSGLTTGIGMRMVANSLTSGSMFELESSDAGFAGLYIRCFDGAANDFSVGEDGRVVIAGVAAITALAVTAGDITTGDGAIASAVETLAELGAGVTTFAIDSNVCIVDGEAGGNTISTITGGVAGQLLTLIFTDPLVTITDTNTHAADTIDLVGADTTFADDATLTLVFAAGSWYEVCRSVND